MSEKIPVVISWGYNNGQLVTGQLFHKIQPKKWEKSKIRQRKTIIWICWYAVRHSEIEAPRPKHKRGPEKRLTFGVIYPWETERLKNWKENGGLNAQNITRVLDYLTDLEKYFDLRVLLERGL